MPARLLQVTALAAFFCASARAAPLQIPTNVPVVEVLQQTNSYNYTPVNETNSTIKRVVPISDALVTGQSVSDVEPKVSSTRRLPIGNGADVTAHVKIPKANIAKALILSAKLGGRVAGGVVGGLAVDALIDYGLRNINVGPDGTLTAAAMSQQDYPVSDGFQWFVSDGQYYPSAYGACEAWYKSAFPTRYVSVAPVVNAVAGTCNVTLKNPSDKIAGSVAKSSRPNNCPVGYFIDGGVCTKDKPLTQMTEQDVADWIASRDGWPSSAALALKDMLGQPSVRPALFTPDLDQNLTLQGPNSATGKTTKTTEPVQLVPGTNTVAPPGTPPSQTQPGTKTTTTTKTHPITYSGNSVSYTTNNTTNNSITNNVTNVTTNETKTEEVKDDKEPDQCQKYPDTIGCKEIDFDTPEGEIPRKQIDVAWSPVDLGLGGGSCPAPVQLYDNKQFSYQLACDNLLLIKTMVIAIALFVGGMIIFGGRADQ